AGTQTIRYTLEGHHGNYHTHFVHVDEAGNTSDVISGDGFTLTATPATTTKVPINTRNGNPRGYAEYLPANFSSRSDWPVVVYFHGIGNVKGSGSDADLDRTLNNSIMRYVRANPKDFVVLFPQDHNGFWGTRGYTFMEWALAEYANTTNTNSWHMIYMSGGGGAFSNIVEDAPNSLSVVASHTLASALTGAGDEDAYRNFADSSASLWVHHQNGDGTVGAGQTQRYYYGILDQFGAQDISKYRYTLYDQSGHNANGYIYTDNGPNQPQVSGDIPNAPFNMQYFVWGSGSWWEWLLDQER
ncbi:MAG: hypothetical protein AAFX99_35585, partial [Myxococcota bacterium]